MSQEKVEVVQAAHDAWNKGDLQSVLDRLHPAVEWWENPDVYPGLDRLYVGHDGFLKRERDAFDAWESFKIEDEEFTLEQMAKHSCKELEANQTITGVFLVALKDVRQKKSGDPYLSLILTDRTGDLEAKMFDNAAEAMDTFGKDDFIRGFWKHRSK